MIKINPQLKGKEKEQIKGKIMSINETIIYILLQELFENDLFDIDYLTQKYTLSNRQIKKLNEIYNILYGE